MTKHRNAEHTRGWRVTERAKGLRELWATPPPSRPGEGEQRLAKGMGRGGHGHSSPGS